MKKSKKIFIIIGFLIVILMLINYYYQSSKDYNSNYHFVISKIDTTSTGSIKINDTFRSPNFNISIGHNVQINDSILKPSKSKFLFIKRKVNQKYEIIDTIKKTGIFNN